jgi:hypothetical protein
MTRNLRKRYYDPTSTPSGAIGSLSLYTFGRNANNGGECILCATTGSYKAQLWH